jgi:hypothetical protein
MSAKKILLSTLPVPLAAIAGICLVLYPFHGMSSEDDRLCANNERLDQARRHLREADRCFADAIAGLRRVSAAQERLVVGDRRLLSRYIREIADIRDRLHQVSEETERSFRVMVVPEINPLDED